ncbi:MAG: hypothetical protein WBQ86_08925 [Candidatus Binatus sp.]
MAVAIKSPFQLREGEERPLLRPSDDKTGSLAAASVAATPRFVLAPLESLSAFALGAAQRGSISNGKESGETEPESVTQHIPKFSSSERVLRVPSISQQSIKFQKLQEYEGEVLSIREMDFDARLVDLTDTGAQRLEATFSIDEVSPSDKPLMREGAVFYWIIGFRDYPNGQRKTEQFVRFRRLPIWSRRDIARLDARADELRTLLQSDN